MLEERCRGAFRVSERENPGDKGDDRDDKQDRDCWYQEEPYGPDECFNGIHSPDYSDED